MGACYLVYIAIVRKEVERGLGKLEGQRVVWHIVRIDEFHRRQIVGHNLFAKLVYDQVFSERLQRVGLEIADAILLRQQEATHQVVEFGLVNVFLSALCDDAAGTHIVEIVEELRSVTFQLYGHVL